MSKFYKDRWRIMRYLAVAPITFFVYVSYAFGFWMYNIVLGGENGGIKASIFKYLYGVPFLIIDVLYNFIIGTIIWFEIPKEMVYTDRIKRWSNHSEFAKVLAEYLNIWDPDHI